MASLIVITGLDQVPATERWSRLIAPLAEELEYSGLGNLPDLESLRREADQGVALEVTEVAVNLIHFDYGRQLVDRMVEAAGLQHGQPILPARWREYHCGDYFTSSLAEHGYWDEPGQYWYLWPVKRIYEDTNLQFLVIGSAGVDGILWGYRRGQSGLWAWYPMRGEFVWLAPTVQSLLQGWLSGAITV